MADNLPQTLSAQFSAISRLSAFRQFGLVVGLAVVAALATAAIMWATQPEYVVLMAPQDRAELIEARRLLDGAGIPNDVDATSDALLVPADMLYAAEGILLDEGLAADSGGYRRLDDNRSLSDSSFREKEIHRLALQEELEKSIANIDGINSATVFLAIPEDSVFAREANRAKASISVKLRPGRILTGAEVEGIVRHVASSVPKLEASDVNVIDESGRSLSQPGGDEATALQTQQLAFKRELESSYRNNVVEILAPSIGEDGIRVTVSAEVDFTQIETASEIYDAVDPAIASESIAETESNSGVVGGVPGALTNQPPAAGVIANGVDDVIDATGAGGNGPANSSRSSTRNFQNDRTISHTRQAPARLASLSISVVVDDRSVVDEDGALTRVARTPEELDQIRALVRDAVGLNDARGDRLTVVNQSFRIPEALAPPAPTPIWQQPWVWQVARYVAAGIGLLLLVLLVVRPVLKNLSTLPPAPAMLPAGADGMPTAQINPADFMHAQQSAAADAALGRAREVAAEDPKLVAQVVRSWMNTDGK